MTLPDRPTLIDIKIRLVLLGIYLIKCESSLRSKNVKEVGHHFPETLAKRRVKIATLVLLSPLCLGRGEVWYLRIFHEAVKTVYSHARV